MRFLNEIVSLLRAGARSCLEGNLTWASSAFPDAKSRSTVKTQTLGKHKLSVSDSSRPSKSKVRKTSIENVEINNLFAEPGLQPVATAEPNDVNLRFDLSSIITDDLWPDNIDGGPHQCMDSELLLEAESYDVLAHNYVPGLLQDLDDWSVLPEYTDIG